jgi:GAF domain-containing protein
MTAATNHVSASVVNSRKSEPDSSVLVRQLLLGTLPPGENLLQHALRTIRVHLGMDAAFISEFKDGHRVLHRVNAEPGRAVVAEGQKHLLEETYCQRIVDGRMGNVVPNAWSDREAVKLPITQALAIGSYMGVPVRRSSGEVYGTFCCLSATPNTTLNDRDVQLMQLFATFISGLLEQDLAADEARQQKAQLIQEALASDILQIAYQPIVHVARMAVVGYEALARFRKEPSRPPDEWFLDAAAVGMQVKLEIKAIEQAVLGWLASLRTPILQ